MFHHFLGMSALVSYLMMSATPQCTPNKGRRCNPPLNNPRNGYISGNCNNRFGSVCNFRCREGYVMNGASNVRCDERSGQWNSRAPRCEVSARYETPTCFALDAPFNGRKSGRCNEGVTAGSECRFSCNPGYILDGHSSLVCQVNGNWDFDPPSCRLSTDRNVQGTCPPLLAPLHGTYTGNCSPGIQERKCVFSCDSRYALVGFRTLNCGSNNQWSSAPPICREVTCTGPDCSYQGN